MLYSKIREECTPSSSHVPMSQSFYLLLAVSPSTSVRSFFFPLPLFDIHSFEVGNPAFMSDASKELTLRVHDKCMHIFFVIPTGMNGFISTGNGSDIFASDI